MLQPLLLLFLISPVYSTFEKLGDHQILRDVHRVLQKRDIAGNMALDNPRAFCRNGGIYSRGICHCIHPHTGPQCEHFACVHGISVGRRYDPDSLLFNTPCICDDGWRGELCSFKPEGMCQNRGEWKNERCECIGFFFGSECQYTSRCIEGAMKNGKCICHDRFEGDYCDRITCDYGSPNFNNRSMSCVCPDKYTGRHCNQCKKTGPLIERFPVCTFSIKAKKTQEQAIALRLKQKQEMRKKIWIVSMCVFALVLLAAFIVIAHCVHRNARKEETERGIRMKEERHKLLTNQVRLQKLEEDAAKESLESITNDTIEERKRRKSEPNLFATSRSCPKLSAEAIEMINCEILRRKDTMKGHHV